MNRNKLLPLLAGYFSGVPGLAAAYLFGSAAGGAFESARDIDVAVLFDDSASGKPDLLRLMTECSRLTGKDVDVVILNTAEPFLYHEILRTGVLVTEKNRTYRIRREVLSKKRYQDYLHIHGIYMRGMRKSHGR